MAKHLFEWPKRSLWNIECSNTEYIHWSSVSIPLGAVSLAGVSISGVATVLTKKYQKRLEKVVKLVDIMTLALAVFEKSTSKVLNNGRVDE